MNTPSSHDRASPAPQRPRIVLKAVLGVLRPLVRLLLKAGVGYPAFAAALKPVFLEAARAELAERGMAVTDSALTLLSGVHRRDVRTLVRGPAPAAAALEQTPLSQAAEVVARWMTDDACLGPGRRPRALARAEFDALVAGISQDTRPRAMLDELLRLGAVVEAADGIALAAAGFAPRQGYAETAHLLADNLRDHAEAAARNLEGGADFLEQAVWSDGLSAESAAQLQRVAVHAWRDAFQTVMRATRERYDADAARPASERSHRARFGVYFFSDRESPP